VQVEKQQGAFVYLPKLLAATFLVALMACSGAGPRSSKLTTTEDPMADVINGRIAIHAVIMKEVQAGSKRIDFKDLLDADKVFAAIASSQQALSNTVAVRQTTAGISLTLASPSTTNTGGTTLDAATEDGEASDASAPTPAPATTPTFALTPSAASAVGLSSAYHDVLYATADAILGGESVADIYNVDAVPDRHLFAVPVIATVTPGQATRQGYTAESELTFKCASPTALARGDFRILAVAPAGFTRVVAETSSMLRQLGLTAGVSLPVLSTLVAQGQFSQLNEQLDQLAHVVSRPDFQVSVESKNVVRIRFLGHENAKGGVGLEAATYDTEILIVATKADVCSPDEAQDNGGNKKAATAKASVVGGAGAGVRRSAAFRPMAYSVASRFVPFFPVEGCSAGESCAVYTNNKAYGLAAPVDDNLLTYETAPTVTVSGAVWEKGGRNVVIAGTGFDSVNKIDSDNQLCATVFEGTERRGGSCSDEDPTRNPNEIVIPADKDLTEAVTKEKSVSAVVEVQRNGAQRAHFSVLVKPSASDPPPDPAKMKLTSVTAAVHPGHVSFTAKFTTNGTTDPTFLVDGQPALLDKLKLTKAGDKKGGDKLSAEEQKKVVEGESWFHIEAVISDKARPPTYNVEIADHGGGVLDEQSVQAK
jgi:hypothetical protein